jgi:preprotein translocase subunit SecG
MWLVILLCIVLALVTFLMGMAILLQEPKQSGLSGSFGMGGDQMLGAGSANPLSKLTGILASVFLALCLGIGLLEQSASEQSRIPELPGDEAGVPAEVGGIPGEVGGDAVTPPMPPPAEGGSGLSPTPAESGGTPPAPPPTPAPGEGSGG